PAISPWKPSPHWATIPSSAYPAYLGEPSGQTRRRRSDGPNSYSTPGDTIECVYLHAFETGSELRDGLAKWIGFYNTRPPHSVFAGRTPDEVYFQIAPTPSPGHAPEMVSAIPLAA
ncbi:MAG: integrase core domain-containing protein, partial [Rhodospirillales bacterium]|nr:integrase core domain-containing protein [Rhodospirillales bacterium]